MLWILFGAVSFVLLIACANVANLQLARASVRQKERHVAGVEVVGAIDDLPLTGERDANTIAISGRPPLTANQLPLPQVRSVSPDYFRAMAIPIVSGRPFTDPDTSNAPGVVLINQTTAHRLFPNEKPVGQRLTFGAATSCSRGSASTE